MAEVSKVNFQGINNLKVYKKPLYERVGLYCNNNGEICRGNHIVQEIKIRANLTDDKSGEHLSEFLNKAPFEFINMDIPELFELYVKKQIIKNETNSVIMLNEQPLIVNKARLALLTFLAKITRECANNGQYSENVRNCIKSVNASIQEIAERYLNL